MSRATTSRTLICLLASLMAPQQFFASPPAQAASAADAAASPKKPGVKRIGVVTAGNQGEAVRGELIALLQGDGTIVEAIPLTARIEVYRQAEAQRKECDYILEASFDAKPKGQGGGFLSRAAKAAKTINAETGSFNNSQSRIQETDRKTGSLENISQTLTPDPKDKVKVGYKLLSVSAKQALVTNAKEVTGADLPSFLETFVNDIVTEAVRK